MPVRLFDAKEISKLYNTYCNYSHPEKRKGNLLLARHCHDSSKVDIWIKPCLIDLVGDVTVQSYVHIMDDCKIFTHEHDHGSRRVQLERVGDPDWIKVFNKEICSDVWIYSRSIILPKCTFIAKGCIIGTGSVVTKPIEEEYSLWAGSPARRIGSR